MLLEKQVCSKEYGEKLASLGVKVVAHWSLVEDVKGGFFVDEAWKWPGVLKFPAFSVAELGEMFPDYYKSFRKQCGEWACSNFAACVGKAASLSAETEANARAKMLVYLLENGHIKAEELNAKENKG